MADDGRSFDWSIDLGTGLQFEVSNEEDDAVVVDMTWTEIKELHRLLTLRLLRQRSEQ